MHRLHFISVNLLLTFLACTSQPSGGKKWTKEECLKALDSIPLSSLIAAYSEDQGYSLLVKQKAADQGALKLTFISNYPTLVDSLLKTGTGEYESSRFHTRYQILDSEVLCTVFQKVIHPSSNWQGQSPWQEVDEYRYSRLDRSLK